MAHGIGGIKAGGLAPFAQRFASSGFAAVAFDYQHWGDSTGEPRQFLSSAVSSRTTAVRWLGHAPKRSSTLHGCLCGGTSFAGMHIVELAASEPGLAGAIAQCPLVDGLAGLTNIPAPRALRLTAYALADLAGSLFGRPVRYLLDQRASGAARGHRNRPCDDRHGPTRPRRWVLVQRDHRPGSA